MPQYKYRPVTRVVTIEFRPVKKPTNGLEIAVTPEYLEARSGDTIQWIVQGLPRDSTCTVGNFTALGASATIKHNPGRKVVALGKPAVMKDVNLKLPKGVPTYDTTNVDTGPFKYDVFVDGKLVYDPDVEIKGPKN